MTEEVVRGRISANNFFTSMAGLEISPARICAQKWTLIFHTPPEHVLNSKKCHRGLVNGFCWENV